MLPNVTQRNKDQT